MESPYCTCAERVGALDATSLTDAAPSVVIRSSVALNAFAEVAFLCCC